jgi:hypothetical protein
MIILMTEAICNILGPIIQTLIGALIALLPLWIKIKVDRKDELRYWFNDAYIENMIEPLLMFMNFSRDHLLFHLSSKDDDKLKIPVLQYSQLNKLYQITKEHQSSRLIHFILEKYRTPDRASTPDELATTLIPIFNLVIPFLQLLREDLLKTKINKKSDILQIKLSKETLEKLDEINTWFESNSENK